MVILTEYKKFSHCDEYNTISLLQQWQYLNLAIEWRTR